MAEAELDLSPSTASARPRSCQSDLHQSRGHGGQWPRLPLGSRRSGSGRLVGPLPAEDTVRLLAGRERKAWMRHVPAVAQVEALRAEVRGLGGQHACAAAKPRGPGAGPSLCRGRASGTGRRVPRRSTHPAGPDGRHQAPGRRGRPTRCHGTRRCRRPCRPAPHPTGRDGRKTADRRPSVQETPAPRRHPRERRRSTRPRRRPSRTYRGQPAASSPLAVSPRGHS